MKEIICKNCGVLLIKAEKITGIITCPKCNKTNWVHHCELCGKQWHEVIYDDFMESIIDYHDMYAVGIIKCEKKGLQRDTNERLDNFR